jgi:hypothetical protein
MIFGISTQAYTLVHVVLSLIGIVSGFVVLFGMFNAKRLDRWTALFLITTALTSLTGFGFPFHGLLPAHKLGILSLVVLAIAVLARYVLHLSGHWRWIYVVTAQLALYFNVFVLVVQAFEKVPALKRLAPTQSEAPFLIAQLVVLAAFVAVTIAAVRRFHLDQGTPALSQASRAS